MIEKRTDGLLQLNKPHEELCLIEEEYRAIFNNAAVGIDLVSGEGRFLEANSTLQNMLGYTEEELKGLSIIDITFPEDIQIYMEKLDALTKGVGSSSKLEARYLRKDGSLLWVDISISAIRGSDGRHIATIGVISDITPRKLTELNLVNALAETQRLREALDHVPSYVYMKDTQSRYIYANQMSLKLFGCSPEELVGLDDSHFFPPDTVKRLQEVDSRVFAGEHTFEEIDVAGAGCQRHVYLEVKTPIYAEPERKNIWGLLGISTDITELKQLEEEKGNLIIDLQKALSEVKKLSGFLPICSSCKKIRDDQGYWSEVERYIGEHSEVQFSHGICPDCVRKLYPEIADKVLGRMEKDEKK